MDPTAFKSPASGRVVKTLGGYWAFIPASEPPRIQYDQETVFLLSQADAALSELSGLGRHLVNPHLLIAPYIRREAVLSSRIEGTRTNLAQLLLEELHPGFTGEDPDDVREVRNYVKAMEHGVRRLKKLPLGLRVVRELHETLMKGVRGEYATPGEFRRSQNWIGAPGSTIATATYVPPPPDELPNTLAAWERFVNMKGSYPDLIQCAIMHEQFEAIHPFLDGNGRVGRLLITLFLLERGRLSQPLLYLSAYLEATRPQYYAGLQSVRTEGDWTMWIRYFLKGVYETAIEAVVRAGKLMDLREHYRQRFKDSLNGMILLDHLFANPYLTANRAAAILEVSLPTARKVIHLLKRHRLLVEATGREWGRIFVAKPILTIIEETEQPNLRLPLLGIISA